MIYLPTGTVFTRAGGGYVASRTIRRDGVVISQDKRFSRLADAVAFAQSGLTAAQSLEA